MSRQLSDLHKQSKGFRDAIELKQKQMHEQGFQVDAETKLDWLLSDLKEMLGVGK